MKSTTSVELLNKIIMLRFTLFLLAFGGPLLLFAQVPQIDYIERYKKVAVSEMERSGIPASITLAQGILESSSGQSELATRAKNHFGIKCHKVWKGPTYYKEDDDLNSKGELIKSCFRSYDSPLESYHDHSEFLMSRSRYAFLFDLEKKDYKGWAHGLKKAGYATNPQYGFKLIKVIEKYGLWKFDHLSSQILVEKTNDHVVIGEPVRITEPVKSAPVDVEVQPTEKPKLPIPQGPKYTKTAFSINGLQTVFVQPEDSWESISKRYNISVSALIEYNQTPLLEEIGVGNYIFLQKKKKRHKGKQKIHIVKENESMLKIAQRYGMRVEKLIKKNRLTFGQEPEVGEQVHLKRKAKSAPRIAK